MRNTLKDLFASILASIGMAMTIFCLAGIVFDIGFKGNFALENYQFTKMVIGCTATLQVVTFHSANVQLSK